MEVDRMYVQRLINQIGVPITDGGGGSDVCWKAQYQDMPVIQVFIFEGCCLNLWIGRYGGRSAPNCT